MHLHFDDDNSKEHQVLISISPNMLNKIKKLVRVLLIKNRHATSPQASAASHDTFTLAGLLVSDVKLHCTALI